jgi:hypothetical protein
MTKSARFKTLLERGYFPEELPPPFHTRDLGKYRAAIFKAWNALGSTAYPSAIPAIYSNTSIRSVRRNLAIVNPVPQLFLSHLIAEHWATIRRHISKNTYSIEIPEIQSQRDRAIPKPDFALIAIREIELSATFDHALVSDVSRFYSTLYTHAIPWALHEKDWCKRNLHSSSYNTTLGNRLDVAVRKGQDNQTIGIPTGPDTSRILSEIIGVAIDNYLHQNLGIDRTRAFRNIDDWYIGFNNAGEAEDCIATLATGCRTFELELNAEKTRTLHASIRIGNTWPAELRASRVNTARGLEHYFVKAFQFANDFPRDNVLDFAIKRTRGFTVRQEDWAIYESFLLKAARANATVIPAVVQILVSYNFSKYRLGRDRIGKLIEDLIAKNAPLAHHAEVAWALFLAKGLRIRVSRNAARAVSGLENAICALLALDLRARGLVQPPLDTGLWQLSMTGPGLLSHMWLLAYEADLKGWLRGSSAKFVDNDKYFSILKQRRISFYDEMRNVLHIKRQKPSRRLPPLLTFEPRVPLTSTYNASDIDLLSHSSLTSDEYSPDTNTS